MTSCGSAGAFLYTLPTAMQSSEHYSGYLRLRVADQRTRTLVNLLFVSCQHLQAAGNVSGMLAIASFPNPITYGIKDLAPTPL